MKAAQYLNTASEHDLQVNVLEYFKLNGAEGVCCFAIPNAAKRTMMTAARVKAEGLMAGVADLCIMLPGGRVAWLELKTGRGRQSDEQFTFECICEVLGHPYFLARTFEGAIAALRKFGALRKAK